MISNKRIHKKAQNKTYKYGTPVHKPNNGLRSQKPLSSNAVTALLRGEDPLFKAERERKEAQEATRATFAHEMELNRINEENKMADMKSELTKVISAWEDKPETDDATDNTIPEVPQMSTKTNASVSQTVFDYVRDNPNVSRKHVANVLSQRGYLETTVTALVSQFIRQKLFVFGVGKGLIVTRKTYTPMYHKDNKPAKPAAPQGIASIQVPEPAPRPQWIPPPPETVSAWTVESVVDKLNIRQARAVYNELRALLGKE
jgi:hypothetical protein